MTAALTTKLMRAHPTIQAKKIYFIGFSLGAQVAGYYARSFAKQTNTTIGRITSLDAAAPLFFPLNISPRRGDADLVEAVHTSTKDNLLLGKTSAYLNRDRADSASLPFRFCGRRIVVSLSLSLIKTGAGERRNSLDA